MKVFKKVKIPLFFLFSYIILVPIINSFLKVLEKCFHIDLNTIDVNLLNLFTVIFRNKIIFVSWILLNLIILLFIKNVITTKKVYILSDIEGKKERWYIWNSRLGK